MIFQGSARVTSCTQGIYQVFTPLKPGKMNLPLVSWPFESYMWKNWTLVYRETGSRYDEGKTWVFAGDSPHLDSGDSDYLVL